jgi:transposase
MREVVNGLMYILSTGCQWRAIPKDLPPRSTLYDYLLLPRLAEWLTQDVGILPSSMGRGSERR